MQVPEGGRLLARAPPIPRPRGASRPGSYKGWIDRTLEVNLHDWRMFLIASKLGI